MTPKCARLLNSEGRSSVSLREHDLELATNLPSEIPCRPNVLTLNCGPPDGGLRRAARRLRASYNACASGATPCKFQTRQPARPAGKAKADRQFQRRVRCRAGTVVQALLLPHSAPWTLLTRVRALDRVVDDDLAPNSEALKRTRRSCVQTVTGTCEASP